MNQAADTVSVIIPTCGRDDFLVEAVHCVMAQTCLPREIIVVDDTPSESTAAVVSDFGSPVRYVQQPRLGPSAARNHGLRLAQGRVVGFLDDDDLWPSGRLESQLMFLREQPDSEVVLGHTQRMLKRVRPDGEVFYEKYREPLRLYHLGCALFRRSVFEKVGTFCERMKFAEDDDWFMRARELKIDMRFQPEVSLYYRFHETNMTHDRQAKTAHLLHLLKNRLDRKRLISD